MSLGERSSPPPPRSLVLHAAPSHLQRVSISTLLLMAFGASGEKARTKVTQPIS